MAVPAGQDLIYQSRHDFIKKLLNDTSGSSTNATGSNPEAAAPPIKQKTWSDAEQLIEDNLREVYEKLPSLEKQIWGKLIVMESSRRTAKAYLRHPVITVDGSDAEFDGMRIGISRFENPTRTESVYEIFNEILQGIKVKIDPDGNIWAKRMTYAPVFLKPLYRSRPNDLFMINQRPVKVFDIRRFKEILVFELKQANPDRRKLEKCCFVCLKFSLDHYDLLRTPCWILVIHLVAIELLNMVLPKDNELSSPSSSFIPGPGGFSSAAPPENINVGGVTKKSLPAIVDLPPAVGLGPWTKQGHGVENGIPFPGAIPLPHCPQRSFINKASSRGGAVFRRIVRKGEDQRGWPPMEDGCGPDLFGYSGQVMVDNRSPMDRIYSSMCDLRTANSIPNLHKAIAGGGNSFGEKSTAERNWILSGKYGPFATRGINERVFSMDALNHTNSNLMLAREDHFACGQGPPFFGGRFNKPEHHQRQQEAMTRASKIKKWRSQDSGLGSGGSGSFGSK